MVRGISTFTWKPSGFLVVSVTVLVDLFSLLVVAEPSGFLVVEVLVLPPPLELGRLVEPVLPVRSGLLGVSPPGQFHRCRSRCRLLQ